MSIWDYKYGGDTVRRRFDNMIGTDSGPVEWVFRLAFIAFMLVTMSDPTARTYISPVHWAGIIALIFWT